MSNYSVLLLESQPTEVPKDLPPPQTSSYSSVLLPLYKIALQCLQQGGKESSTRPSGVTEQNLYRLTSSVLNGYVTKMSTHCTNILFYGDFDADSSLQGYYAIWSALP
jgi:hypothetical protein